MDNIVDNVQTKETIVYEDVRAKLPDLSAKRTVAGNSKTAYRVQKPSDAPKGSGPGREKDCNWCRKRKMRSQGHTWNECRKLNAHNAKQKEEKAQQVSPDTEPGGFSGFATAFMVSKSTPKHKSTCWIFDTGTSSHKTPNKDLFISFKPCSGITKSARGGIALRGWRHLA